MPHTGHVADRLAAWAAGDLEGSEAERVREHIGSCSGCAEERDLLQQGTSVLGPPRRAEPRNGFAVRVAAHAAELGVRPVGAPWWRWAFGAAVAAAAIAAVVVVAPRSGSVPGEEILVAQRLDLFEDFNVVQNQDALRDIDVVAQLHKLGSEGNP